jgi:DNA-binding response OmpR family regulator
VATLLIIDHTPTNLAVMVGHLETQGYRVLVAQDGEEGLQRAELTRPDLILLDVMMPGPGGLEVCRRLKSRSNTREIPVIFMTSLTVTRDKIAGFAAGAVAYVTKPLQAEEVLARIDTHLKLRAAQTQLEAQNAVLAMYREDLEAQVAERTVQLIHPVIESSTRPMTKQLARVIWRATPAPAKILPQGRKWKSSSSARKRSCQ